VFARLIGQQGIELSGLVGGLVSSTAVTLGFTERSKREPELAPAFGVAIIISWTVMYARMLVLVWIINRDLFTFAWLPLLISAGVGLAYSRFLVIRQRNDEIGNLKLKNPLDLASAIRFGLLFTFVLLISRIAQFYFGNVGVLLSALFTGLADVNAITLTVADLSRNGDLNLQVAAQALLLAIVANMITKGGIVMFTGNKDLRKVILPGLILMLVTAIVMVIFF
jgi:uncharacterized membrane protein (DUF4010 family)